MKAEANSDTKSFVPIAVSKLKEYYLPDKFSLSSMSAAMIYRSEHESRNAIVEIEYPVNIDDSNGQNIKKCVIRFLPESIRFSFDLIGVHGDGFVRVIRLARHYGWVSPFPVPRTGNQMIEISS